MNLDNLKKHFGNHLSRWLVAMLLLPPILYAIGSDYYLLFFLVMLVIGGLCWWEFNSNFLGRERVSLLSLGIIGWVAVACGAYFYGPGGQSFGLLLALALGAFYCMWNIERQNGPMLLNLLGRYALGHLYISFLMSFFLLLKKLDSGPLWLYYILFVTVIADTAAFYSGRKCKGPKLCSKISPNKTVSGLLGGAIGAMLASIIATTFLPSGANWAMLAVLGLFLGFWGAVGDLFESALKRAVGVKDSSGLLMGHGGFMDRLDSLLFNIAPVYVIAEYITLNYKF